MWNRRNSIVIALVLLALCVVWYRVEAQGPCAQNDTPGLSSRGKLDAWGQNSIISVNFDANTISPQQYNCRAQNTTGKQ